MHRSHWQCFLIIGAGSADYWSEVMPGRSRRNFRLVVWVAPRTWSLENLSLTHNQTNNMTLATTIEVKPKLTITKIARSYLGPLFLMGFILAQYGLIYLMIEDGAATSALAMKEGLSVRNEFGDGKISGDVAVAKLESISRVGAAGFNVMLVSNILQRENKFEERNKYILGEINRLPDHQLVILFSGLPDPYPESLAPEHSFFNSLTAEQAQKVKACQEKIAEPEGELAVVKAFKVGYNALYPQKSKECVI